MTAKKILIVEDEKDIIDIYKMKLEKEWFIVDIARDGFLALTKVVEFKPDLVLLDIMMPNMNWFESLSTIRNLAPSMKDTKIIMFSNLSSQSDIDRAMQSGADWYIIKANFSLSELISKIKEFLWEKEHKSLMCPHCHKDIYEI